MTTPTETPKLTRTERRRLETRESLLDAVVDLLLEQGHNKLSTTEIAERADVAVGTFYNHFLSVPDAIEEAFDAVAPAFAEAIRSDDVATGLGYGFGGFFCRLNEAPRIWKAARIAGWEIRPVGDFALVRGLIDAGVGIDDPTETEIAASAHLLCRLMTSMVDQFGETDVNPHLPGQATRLLASVVMSDTDAIERCAQAAEERYEQITGHIGERGPFHLEEL